MTTGLAEVFLARHGETEWNRQGRRQGQLDSPLTALGVEQAEHTAALLAARSVDGLFASPLGRAAATASVIAQALGLVAVTLDDLREIDHGRTAGLTHAQLAASFPDVAEGRARDKYGFRFPGGENYADGDARAGAALRAIAGTGAQRVVIVAHEMIGRMLLRNLLGLPPGDALRIQQPHDVVFHVDARARRVEELRLPDPRERSAEG